ncbi:hypothetical protein ASD11_00395 [Aeromicrobium sp. Root495]|uniref:hypothetical protein n=1 Tax=Aeromicrobium sp. Root495 TaxID=1736550 RepID=UPI0006F9A1AE|nr:hypothetical protein [Aeromicrobium sp. Root495]KQY58166.1 hypothetical protein ASD11_00395 [Aeromicrobium sp. Root495]
MKPCTYEEFGRLFFEEAVSKERILGVVQGMAGAPVELGPIGVGPGRAAEATATGQMGEASAERLDGDMIRYRVTIPVSLDFEVNLQVDKHRFHGEMVIPLHIQARATEDLKIVIDIEPPKARDVKLDLKASGLRASMLQKVAGIDAEVKRFVVKYVERELEKPEVTKTQLVDVGASIEATWAGMGA